MLCITWPVLAGVPIKKLHAAYGAFAEYDYFKARQLFYKISAKSNQPAASFGLALIALRSDNPFHNLDTATKYAYLSFQYFSKQPTPFHFKEVTVDSNTIRQLIDTVANRRLSSLKKAPSVNGYDNFLLQHYLCKRKYILDALYLRDEMTFNQLLTVYKSDSTRQFIITHPQSLFLKDAQLLFDRQQYDEETTAGNAATYLAFIRRHPKNVLINTALDNLFQIYSLSKNSKGLSEFVREFPQAPQAIEAWKLLFSLSVQGYSFAELKRFVDEYPEFPLKASILKELELNKLVLYPLQMGEQTGFIDEAGRVKIAAVYDEASFFSEGLAVVSKNDSVYYINKENVNPFGLKFQAAYSFRNGIAAVKKNTNWYFINRLGQFISQGYEEISEYSGGAYVYKKTDRYGAFDQFGKSLLEPQFEKLGDFKNGYAYYSDNGLYGFVSSQGVIHKAQFEWISDFNEAQLAVVKKNGRYGIIDGKGKLILTCEYDQIIRAKGRVYIVVVNNLYGLYSFEGCFIQLPQFEFVREELPEYYGDGKYFRLLKKSEQQLVDINGKLLISSAQYEDFGFLENGLLRVKSKGKWGYLDNRFMQHIAPKYTQAFDFEAGVAVVAGKDMHQIIDTSGSTLYESKTAIVRINAKWFFEEREEGKVLIDKKGNVLAHHIEEVTAFAEVGWLLRLQGGEIKLIND